MFHSSQYVHMPNRRGRPRCGFRSFMPTTSFNRQDSKEPLRRGILFSSVAFVLLLIGAMLTWLGLNEPFSNKISMTGPLLIAIALLVLLLSLRQFMLARKRNRAINGTVQMDAINTGGVTTVVVDDEDGNRAATIVVEAWDTDEQLNEEIRNPGELAPPAYTDISQSCSSMCPSFVSHDDHNEAPPTYEETCGGVYLSGSENSLSQQGSHENSAHDSHRSSIQPNPPGYVPTQQTSDVDHDGAEEWRRVRESAQGCLLSPANSGALMAQAAVRRQRQALPPLTLVDSPDQQPMLPVSSPGTQHLETAGDTALIRSSSPENLSPSSFVQSPDSGHLAATAPPTPVPPGLKQGDTRDLPQTWSRRSFSSIPSYTCLLSKSGEVSAQVFDTSSIIQGMLPNCVPHSVSDRQEEEGTRTRGALSPPAGASGTTDLLHSQSVIPARSHSLSSVLPLRQGVPYAMCHTHGQARSPGGSLVTSSPRLSSPQHSLDVTHQDHQQHHQLRSSVTNIYKSSTSLSLPSPVSDIHSLSQTQIGSPDFKPDGNSDQPMPKTSMVSSKIHNDQPEDGGDEVQASGRLTAVGDKETILEQRSRGEEDFSQQARNLPEQRCPSVLSSQDIQETI